MVTDLHLDAPINSPGVSPTPPRRLDVVGSVRLTPATRAWLPLDCVRPPRERRTESIPRLSPFPQRTQADRSIRILLDTPKSHPNNCYRLTIE
jgi:hypothetical protein